MRLRAILLVLPVLLASALLAPLRADRIVCTDGVEFVGKIVAEEETRVLIEVQMGKMTAKKWVERKVIASIERGATPADEFQTRLAALPPFDVAGHRALAAWAEERGLLAEKSHVESLLPRVELAARRHENPRTWCRTCGADGEAICVPCKGEGKLLTPCTRCEGRGTLPCKTCGGDADAMVRCKRCAGEGEYEKFDPARGRKVKTECGDCRGKGEHECPTCSGKGSTECPSCEGTKGETKECEACLGKPKRVCETCGGKGIQPTPVTDEELAKERTEAERRAAEDAARAAVEGAKGAAEPGAEKKKEKVIEGNPFGKPGGGG